VAQVVKCLASKHKPLSSIPSITKKEGRGEKNISLGNELGAGPGGIGPHDKVVIKNKNFRGDPFYAQ
jgi:hypothetical protein